MVEEAVGHHCHTVADGHPTAEGEVKRDTRSARHVEVHFLDGSTVWRDWVVVVGGKELVWDEGLAG